MLPDAAAVVQSDVENTAPESGKGRGREGEGRGEGEGERAREEGHRGGALLPMLHLQDLIHRDLPYALPSIWPIHLLNGDPWRRLSEHGILVHKRAVVDHLMMEIT